MLLPLLLNLAPTTPQAQKGGGVVNRNQRRTVREGGYGFTPEPAQAQPGRDDDDVLILLAINL